MKAPTFGVTSAFVLFSAVALAAVSCSGDNFGVSDEGGDGDTAPSSIGGQTTKASGGSSGDGDATGGEDSQTASGGDAQGSGGAEADGVRRGPALSDIDTTLGGMNGDLAEPAACPEFPGTMCIELTGMLKGSQEISATCMPDTFDNDSGNVTCQGVGMSIGLNLKMFSGAPPSSFKFTVEPLQYPIIFEWDDAGFATHKAGVYAVAESHEFVFRTEGVVYEEEFPDDSRVPYVAGVFSVSWTKRPTCPSCADVRLRGNFAVYTGP